MKEFYLVGTRDLNQNFPKMILQSNNFLSLRVTSKTFHPQDLKHVKARISNSLNDIDTSWVRKPLGTFDLK